MDAVFKTTTEYMNYSEDVVEGLSSLKISEFCGPRLSKDSKLMGVGEVFTKNVVDGSRYWKHTLMMKNSMPHGIW